MQSIREHLKKISETVNRMLRISHWMEYNQKAINALLWSCEQGSFFKENQNLTFFI